MLRARYGALTIIYWSGNDAIDKKGTVRDEPSPTEEGEPNMIILTF